jgi:sortase A
MKRRRIYLANALTVAGLLLLGYCAYVFLQARFFQAAEQRKFDASLHAPPGPVTAIPAPRTGEVMGRLEIPRLALSVMVVEGDDGGDLKRAAGHIPGTALPGQPGNTGIAAHRDTYFRPLRSIRLGDTIDLDTLRGNYQYRVVSTKIVTPEDNQVLSPTAKQTLTLVTCYPFYYVGPAPNRFIVQAQRTDQPVLSTQTPAGGPPADQLVGAVRKPMFDVWKFVRLGKTVVSALDGMPNHEHNVAPY